MGDLANRTSAGRVQGWSPQGASSRPWPGALLLCMCVMTPQLVATIRQQLLMPARSLRTCLHCRVRLSRWCQDSSCPCQQSLSPPPCFLVCENKTSKKVLSCVGLCLLDFISGSVYRRQGPRPSVQPTRHAEMSTDAPTHPWPQSYLPHKS